MKFAALADIAELNPRQSARLSLSEPVAFVPMASVSAETASTAGLTLRPYGEVAKGYTPMCNGDVLVAKITPCFENGKIAHAVLPTSVGFGSTEFHVVRARSEAADARYLLHFLRQGSIRIEGERRMTGSGGQRRVPANFLAELRVPLPPLPEQRRIADVLDRAETLRAQRRQALAQLDALAEAIFLDMFGDPKHNPKALTKQSIGSLVRFKSGDFLPASEMAGTGEFPVYGGNGVNGTHDRFLFDERRIVVGRVGAYCGCVHVSPANSWVTDNALYVSEMSNSVEFDYLVEALRLAKLNDYASQSGQPLVSASRLYPVEVLVPPLDRQRAFVRRLACVSALGIPVRASSELLNALFASLQHRAFRGEL